MAILNRKAKRSKNRGDDEDDSKENQVYCLPLKSLLNYSRNLFQNEDEDEEEADDDDGEDNAEEDDDEDAGK